MAPNLLLAADTVRQVAVTAPPTREQGTQTRLTPVSPWSGLTVGLLQEAEYSPAWRWPHAWRTVDLMRSDSQVDSLYDAISLSVRRRNWMVDPQQADSALAAAVADDLGLPVKGSSEPARAGSRERFSFNQHLQQAVLSLLYGFFDFEIVGHVDETTNLWRLDKLAPRPPRTVMYVSTDELGDFASITQVSHRTGDAMAEPIPADHLVHYCWGREGANWYGRSLLRSVYREVDIKDRLIKVDAVKHQRNGMGVPVPHATDPSVGAPELAKAQAVAAQFRAGEDASAAMPYGIDMRLLGVQGQLPDTLASIKEHNEAIARRFHAMFFMLGQTSHGSRALGQTDKEYWDESIDQIADDLADMLSKQLVERWVEWNAGLGVSAPAVVSERVVKDDPGPTDTGGAPAPVEQAQLPAAASRPRRAPALAAVTVDGVNLPDRPLRRQPNGAEAAAGVDFAAIEQAYVDAVDELTAGLGTLRASQIDDLVAQVRAAGDDLEALAQVSTDPVGAEQIAASMRAMAASGVQDALSEAKHQGVSVDAIDLDALEQEITQRAAAVAQTLASDVSSTAAKAAVRLVGVTGLEGDLADSVGTYLGALKWQTAEVAARGVLQGAMNAGRFGQFDAVEQAADTTRYYHSALLDQNTCGPCADQDGYEYADLQDVEASFAGSGGFALCEGAERCRCTSVLVVGEAAPTLP
jgi:hypothetical protein